jgi:arylsulfatase A-like enzyme
VVVTGDHGELLGEDGRLGHKRSFADGVVHVPLMLRTPTLDPHPAPSVVETQVSLVDVLPTVLSLAQVSAPALQQGRSLLGLVSAPVWSPGVADPRVQPAMAWITKRGDGDLPVLAAAVITRDWRLEDNRDGQRLLHREHGTWVPSDDVAARAALAERYAQAGPASLIAVPPLSAETL